MPALTLVAVATLIEMRTRRVPRILPRIALVAALAVHGLTGEDHGLIGSALGLAIAWALLMPAWFVGWLRGRDVGLVAAVGAWLGLPFGPLAAVATLVFGAVLALVSAARRGVMPGSLWGAAGLAAWAATSRGRASMPQPPASSVQIPFSLAVLAGAGASLLFHG